MDHLCIYMVDVGSQLKKEARLCRVRSISQDGRKGIQRSRSKIELRLLPKALPVCQQSRAVLAGGGRDVPYHIRGFINYKYRPGINDVKLKLAMFLQDLRDFLSNAREYSYDVGVGLP
ncbi:hypothetical protein DSO57_1011462 [Entomophthora muscae]|uniref:Uncharacterized protein n=1 Tax=Entomophthora muscae TaxID=34485 RepID=A0ACC2S808_9FUNG|nr:hypothetical protein DSO57_1011462 [Entomophthora muscae]